MKAIRIYLSWFLLFLASATAQAHDEFECSNDLSTKHQHHSQLKESYLQALSEVLNPDDPKSANWTSYVGGCIPLSKKLMTFLLKKGFHPQLIRVESNHPLIIDGNKVPAMQFHYFLVDQTVDSNEYEIIIDPTYRQFLQRFTTPPQGIPSIFVGNRSELREIFREYTKWISSLSLPFLPRDSGIDSDHYIEVTFGFGRGAHTRDQRPLY